MDGTIIAAVIGAIGAVAAAVILTKKKMHVEVDLIKKARESRPARQDRSSPSSTGPPRKPELAPAELEPTPPEREFMTDEYVVQLATKLQMHAQEGDEVRFVDKTSGRDK